MDNKLTLGSKFRYGLADLGFALITSAMQFFLLFYYTDVAGINPGLAGAGPDGRQVDLGCDQRSACSAIFPTAHAHASGGGASTC